MPDGRRTRILVVEDDFATASTLIQGLTRAGFEVSLSTGEEDGVPRFTSGPVDLAIIDMNVMEQRGLDVISRWRGRSSIPLIALAGRDQTRATLEALTAGAADCVTKPVWMDELVARIRARIGLRPDSQHRVRTWGRTSLEMDSRRVLCDGRVVPLTCFEFNILAWLVEHPYRVIVRRELAERALSPSGHTTDRTVDCHIARLRRKLGADASAAIRTVRGVGYRFDPAGGGS